MKHFNFKTSLAIVFGLLLGGVQAAYADDYDLSTLTQTGEDIDLSTTQEPTTNYSTTTVETGISETSLVYAAYDTDGKLVAARATSDGWFDKDSKLAGWGNNSSFFVQEATSNNYSTFNIGQFPGAFTSAGSQTVTIYLINESAKTYYKVNITLNVQTATIPTLAEMTQEGDDINLSVEEELNSTEVANVATGVSASELKYCAIDASGNLVDAINATDGWFGKDGKLCKWGADGYSMYIHKGGDFPASFDIGQNTGYFTSVGQSQTVTLYLVNTTDKKYYKVNVTLTIKEPEDIDLSTYTQTQEISLSTTQEPTTDFSTTEVSTGISDASLAYYAYNTSDKLVKNSTDGWFNKDSKLETYGNNSAFFVHVNSDYSTLTVGQYPNAFQYGGSQTVTLYLVNTTAKTYYKVNITLNVNAPKQTVTVSDAKYATVVAADALDFTDSGLKAFAVNYSDGAISYTEITKAPKGSAVLVYGSEAKDYSVTEVESADAITNSLTAASADVTTDGTQYILANGSDGLGWYKATGTIPTGKGYLVISSSSAKSFIAVGEGLATGVNSISAQSADNEATYNVAGQKVGSSYKGIIIKNGKKYLNK